MEMLKPLLANGEFGTSLATTMPGVMAPGSDLVAAHLRSSQIATTDGGAVSELFKAYGCRLFGLMVRRGADAGTATQLAEEALTTVWRKMGRSQPGKTLPTTLIFTVSRDLLIERLRKVFNWQKHSDEMTQESPDLEQNNSFDAGELQSRISAVLEDLGTGQRQIVELAFLDGLSHGEIARRLSIPIGAVKTSMRSTCQKIRAPLSGRIA